MRPFKGAAYIAVAVLIMGVMAATDTAFAATFTAIYSFCGKANCADGSNPFGSLIMDGAGNLYGTTSFGGAQQAGTVFKLAPSGKEKVLYSFCSQPQCSDGRQPQSGLVFDDAGNLYGTTLTTAFQLTPGGQLTVLATASFLAGLSMDSAGNLYGTANANGQDIVFELVPNADKTSWSGSILATLSQNTGQSPRGPLLIGPTGNLFGTAYEGGRNGGGTIFEVRHNPDRTQWTARAIYGGFCSSHCMDNRGPTGNLAMDRAGNLYGTASGLGTIDGAGTVYELMPNAARTKYTFKHLHTFCQHGCADGYEPFGGLIIDSGGTLYGTTQTGGAFGQGTVFSLAHGGSLTVLYSFCPAGTSSGCKDGIQPAAGLLLDGAGNLFGTATENGAHLQGGTVFEVSP